MRPGRGAAPNWSRCGWYGLAHLHAHDKIGGVPLGDAGAVPDVAVLLPRLPGGVRRARAWTPTRWRPPCGARWSRCGRAATPADGGWAGVEKLLGDGPAAATRAWRDAVARHAPGGGGRARCGPPRPGLPGAAARRPGAVPLRRQRGRRPRRTSCPSRTAWSCRAPAARTCSTPFADGAGARAPCWPPTSPWSPGWAAAPARSPRTRPGRGRRGDGTAALPRGAGVRGGPGGGPGVRRGRVRPAPRLRVGWRSAGCRVPPVRAGDGGGH